MGIAFDYWLRAWLARAWSAVPLTEDKWVAEHGLAYLRLALEGEPAADQAKARMDKARAEYYQYVSGDDHVLSDYLRSCLFKANLDYLIRAPVSPDELDYFTEDPKDFEDLLSLVRLTEERKRLFRPRTRLILNPSFGEPSNLVGGADADFVLDHTLIEVKVHGRAKSPQVQWVRQLVGYWLLAAMNGSPDGITHIGVYLARTGELYRSSIKTIAKQVDLVELGSRFIQVVRDSNSTLQSYNTVHFHERLADAVAMIWHTRLLGGNTDDRPPY